MLQNDRDYGRDTCKGIEKDGLEEGHQATGEDCRKGIYRDEKMLHRIKSQRLPRKVLN